MVKQKPLEPFVTQEFLVTFAGVSVRPVVGQLFDENWTWKWNFAFFQVVACCTFTTVGYCWSGYKNRHDLAEFIFSACLIFIDILGIQRLAKFVIDQSEVRKAMIHILKFAKHYERIEEAFPVLLWYCRLLYRVIASISIVLAALGLILSSASLLNYLLFDEMVIFVQCFIPNIDYTKHPGFEIHVVYHYWCTFCTILGINATTIIVLLMLVEICMEADVLRARLKVLGNMIAETDTKNEKIVQVLKEIFKEHQELNEFIDVTAKFLSLQNLSDHCVVGLQTGLSLFICLRQVWLPGYILMTAGLLIIFVLDLLGTIIEVKLENLTFDVYDVPWYLMSLEYQKMYRIFLANTQNTKRFTLGGSIPLCLATFVKFYKRIYSYLMILRESQI